MREFGHAQGAKLVLGFSLVALVTLCGCPGTQPGTTLSGTVTNATSGDPIAGATVALDPAVDGVTITTAADGTYSADIPDGDYTVTFSADNFDSVSEAVTLAGEAVVQDAALTPTAAVVISTSVDGDAAPDGSVVVSASVEVFDGSAEVLSYSWAQGNSVVVVIDNADTDTATVTLPNVAAFKAELFEVLVEPPVTEDELPPNVPFPEGELVSGLQDRFQVVAVNPFNLEEAGHVALTVTVETTSGTFTETADVHTELPWKWSSGIRAVPVGLPVLLYGKTQATYDWGMTPPAGSAATLAEATTQTPEFVPDAEGLYNITVTELAADPNNNAQAAVLVVAGTWEGAISGQTASGIPESDSCVACHTEGGFASDMFTPWSETGHAMIFTDNLNTSTHYGESCFPCHTVGFDKDVDNGGIDDADDYQAFLDAGLLNVPDDNWSTMLASFPNAAQMGNIQCESCHGPQNGGAHTKTATRSSLSSDLCAYCHGEPLRHARFQQWQLSGHGDYELAIDEGDSGSCSRCHTANGFLAWLPVLEDDDPNTDPLDNVEVTWTSDEVHPQTCVTCHDPHSVGTSSGASTDATVRITGDTPPLIAGFTATDVGAGAICMTCHNTRRGLRNDATFADTVAEGDTARAPHGSAQGDVVMGENAYFVTVGTRGSHSNNATVEGVCVECHMQATPPPAALSYNEGGTNHTFFAAEDICGDCHSFEGAEVIQAGTLTSLLGLQALVEDAILDVITDVTVGGDTVDLGGEATITDAADVVDILFGESRGRQAITVTLADDTVVGPVRMQTVTVNGAELYSLADERLPKAGWNWHLVNSDGSLGVHNPSFVGLVLQASIDELQDLAAE